MYRIVSYDHFYIYFQMFLWLLDIHIGGSGIHSYQILSSEINRVFHGFDAFSLHPL